MDLGKKLDIKPGIYASVIAVGSMLGLSLWAWPQIPEDMLVPVHWGLSGQPDGYSNKAVGLLALPAIMSVVAAIYFVRMHKDPRKDNLVESQTAILISWYGVLALMLVVHGLLVLSALGNYMPVTQIVPVGVGILCVLVGAAMGKVRSNHSFGCRTPWTLSSEESWSRTNRLCGWLMCLMGLATIASGLLDSMYLLVGIILGGALLIVSVTFAYSYIIWKQDQNRSSG